MNIYSEHMIMRFHQLYVSRSFDQDDVTLFIISCRDYCKPKGSLREIGDFIAHPQERDRGLTLTSVLAVAPSFEDMLRGERYGGDSNKQLPTYLGIGTREAILADLASVFSLCNAGPVDTSPDSPEFREFLFCLIFLLSQFTLRLGDQNLAFNVEYARDLSLVIKYESINYSRHYARLTVLRIRDIWLEVPQVGHFSPIIVTNHIARRFARGYLCAVPYEADLATTRFDDGDFRSGEMWPLPL
jgi:hypothetical protein